MLKVKKSRLFWAASLSIIVLLLFIFRLFFWSGWFWLQHTYYFLRWGDRAQVAADQHLHEGIYYSSVLGEERDYYVYLPDTVDENTPLLILLHGYPGVPKDFIDNTTLISQLTNRDMAVAFFNGAGTRVRDSQYLDATKIDQAMMSAVLEFTDYIIAHYNLSSDADKHAIGGVSSGAYGALQIGFLHPDYFDTVVSMSGYTNNQEFALHQLIDDPASLALQNVGAYLSQAKVLPKHVLLLYGKNDYQRFLEDGKSLLTLLQKRGVDVVYDEVNGGHGWEAWNNALPLMLDWLKDIGFAN